MRKSVWTIRNFWSKSDNYLQIYSQELRSAIRYKIYINSIYTKELLKLYMLYWPGSLYISNHIYCKRTSYCDYLIFWKDIQFRKRYQTAISKIEILSSLHFPIFFCSNSGDSWSVIYHNRPQNVGHHAYVNCRPLSKACWCSIWCPIGFK